ncbi:hypothetical protein PtA15_5A785 [Puccinia triticina]|uniref:Uncharacterized protein n=1 Tax=Puccinia triticina TaxID=208348 RepID=A0ABY7CM61_9BASI|nr:uncharacterized protein PtA15_5A785 [Puccinia triticina]WAQ85211.1 hypothetical protein PtA15_5A785 [Puccinia triticina]
MAQLDNGTETIEQERITFQRFASYTLVSEKAGFIFNAEAPVWSIDFLPSPELTSHSCVGQENQHRVACDFLAVATISSDPGLIPPAEIAKMEKDAKSIAQIWSIPDSEPTKFHEQLSSDKTFDHPLRRSGKSVIPLPRNGQPTVSGNHNDCPQSIPPKIKFHF